MSKSQSCKNLAPEGDKVVDLRRASSQPLYTPQTTASESSFAVVNASSKSSMDDMRRRIVQLNKELEQERTHSKNLKRDKALEVRQVRDEEQRKSAAMQTELRSKLHKEKMNELTALKEQLHKEKEKDIMQIIRQKDEILRTAQQAWAKEKDELKSKVRNELRSETRVDSKREFEKERSRLEQEIADLHRQKRELEDALKVVQDADKRKIDDIRRIHYEHEAELDKFKRNSWQESRQQMAEIRQLLNIIEQLEKKLGLEAGHSMRLRLEKDSLHDMLKKSTTFDAWDRMMSTGKSDPATPPGSPDSKGSSQELKMLQRKNVELSSLVRKLDEKNQQLATRNAELLAELEKLEKDNRDKNRKLERKNVDLAQINKRLESRNKLLLDEVNSLKKTLTGRKENSIKPRGRTSKEDELGELKAQVREQTRAIADLKQSLMEKDRRIELLRGRKKKSKQQPASTTSQLMDVFPVTDDDALSVHSDFSEASEMSSSEDVDSKRIKKLAKELLALERAYALLQAHVSSAVDAERDEMEKQQLQSDLIESQTRIHELERMVNDSGQGTGLEEICNLQVDNKALYQKLVAAEQARDEAQSELAKYTQDIRELQDERDLLEFELEEMSQLSTAGSEDWDSRRSRNGLESSPSLRVADSDSVVLSLEEIKAHLEELETEKENVLSPEQQSALKQARIMLESMAEKIHHMEITESALRDKVRDLDLGYNSESLKSDFDETRSLSVVTCDRETLTDLQWSELDDMEFYREQQIKAVPTEDMCCMTDLIWEDLVSMESMYRKYLSCFPEGLGTNVHLEKDDKECMTDLASWDLEESGESYRNVLEDLSLPFGKGKGEVENVDSATMTDIDHQDLEQLESTYQKYLEETTAMKSRDDRETMTQIIWEELVQQANNDIYLSLTNEISERNREMESRRNEVGSMTNLSSSQLALMESKHLECIENVHELESNVGMEKDEVAVFSSVDLVETLPEIVLDTFPEDLACTKDECEMTELKCDDIVNLHNKCFDYEHDIGELEKKIALFNVDKEEKSCLTELTWNDIVNLNDKCYGYERIIGELEDKIALFEVEKKDKSSCTELSLQDLVDARYSVETKEVETTTDEPEVPEIVLESYPGVAETRDECDMTEGVWEEVVDLKNTYRDYRQNLEEMKNKLAQFEVEKDDKESITDIAMQDLADLESLYKEHLHDADSDSNSMLSHAEKESRECMTELTFVELSELEDFYIENAARQVETPSVVEKWEQESMTDITYDVMQHLEEVEELYRRKPAGSTDEDVEKDEKCTATDLTIIDLDYLVEMESCHRKSSAEKMDKDTSTDSTIPVLELLEQTEELHQSRPLQEFDALNKADKCVATELTADDLQYWEQVEAAHEECLLDREEDKVRAEMGSEERQDAEISTDFTMIDLQYLEDVDAAHEECLQNKAEELDSGRNEVEKLSVETMTDFTVSDLKYLEDVKAADRACLVDRQEELATSVTSVEKHSVGIMTDLTLSDLKFLEDVEAPHGECITERQEELHVNRFGVERESVQSVTVLEYVEAAHEDCLADKPKELESKQVGEEGETSCVKTKEADIMTDLPVLDLQYLEAVEAAHEECLVDKQKELEARKQKENSDVMTDLTVVDPPKVEDNKDELEALHVEKQNADIMTDLTLADLQYLEDVETAHEECLADKQDELGVRFVDKESVEVMTDLTLSNLNYLEDVEAAHEECRADKQVQLEAREFTMEKENAEVMTDLTVLDLQNLEDKQEELVAVYVEKQDIDVMTNLTLADLQYLEDVETTHEECLADKQDELDVKTVDKQSVEVMTDLTVSDLNYLQEVEAAHEECLVDTTVEKENVEIITDFTLLDLQYLEGVEAAYRECLIHKDNLESRINQEETTSVGTMTDMNVQDLRSLESAAVENVKNKTPKWRRSSRSSSVSDHMQSKNTMTEMTANILEYYEDIEVLYKETLVEFDEFRKLHSVEKMEKDVMTTMTMEDLKYLKDEGSGRQETKTEEKEAMTELGLDYLEFLMEVETLYKDTELDKESKDLDRKSNVETMTDVTISYMEYMELEFERLQQEQSQEKDSSWVVIEPENKNQDVMTELTTSELQYLEEVEVLYKENASRAEPVSTEDAEAMTDLTTADLEYFEEAENLLKRISGNGGELSGMQAPKDDKEVITELTSSDIDYLHTLGDIYTHGNKEAPSDGEFEKDDKCTETELTIAHIRDLEDQAESATEMRLTPAFNEYVHGNFQAETLVDLRSEMDYLPVLDEPEFIMDEDEDSYEIQSQDAAVMTELTLSDLEHLEETEARGSDGLMQSPPEKTDTGVQCTLEDLGLLLQELSREAEEKGADVPSWFVTALKMRQPGGFNPIHLVVRQADEIDALLVDDHPNTGLSSEHIPEETQLSNTPMDLLHLSEDSHECPVSLFNGEIDLLPSDEVDAFSQDIGVQCDLVDVLAMLAEYRRNSNDDDMPWFVSAMNMTREDTGFDPVQVVLRNRSDSSPAQDEMDTKHSNSFVVELSRPPPPPKKTTFTISSPPTVQLTRDEQSEFPEADNPLLTPQNESDSVFNRTDESTNPAQYNEDRDVLTDMPRDGSAVNRFDRFLKERKDSELLNLMALRQGIDDGDIEEIEDVKSLKELEEENELLRKQLQILESRKGAEDLEEENRHLKEKLKELQESDNAEELAKENALLKEKVEALEDTEEENALITEKIKMLEELVLSNQDIKKIEAENDELREKVKALEEASMILEAEMEKTKEENEELKENMKTLVQSMNTEELQRENDYLKQQVVTLAAEPERELEGENQILHEKLEALEASANVVVNENALLKKQIEELEQNENVEDLVNENALLKEQIEIMEETEERAQQLEDENEVLKEKVQILEESSTSERLEHEHLIEKIQDLEHSTGRVVEKLEEENSMLKENIKILEDSTANMKALEDENTLLRERIESLKGTRTKDVSKEEFEGLQKKIEQLKEAEKTIVALNESNTALKARIDILQLGKKNERDISSEMDPSEQLEKELENLKQENRKLYEELTELRRKVQDRQNAERLNEGTQTEYADFPEDVAAQGLNTSRYVIRPVPNSIEDTITPQVRSTLATEVRYLGDSRVEFEPSPEGVAFRGEDDPMDYSGIVSDFENTRPSYYENDRDSVDLVSEPELMFSRRSLDSYMDDIDQRIQDLRNIGEEHPVLTEDGGGDTPRTDTSDLVAFDSDDDGDLPPLPESSPPPLPSEPPPDFTESSPPVLHGLEVLLRSESSPPRDAATLRASSRQRFHSDSKQPSSRSESPVTVEEPTLVLESEPSELGGIYPVEEPTQSSKLSVRRPSGSESITPTDLTTKAPPQVLPKPKWVLLQKRQPGPLNQPVVSYVNSNTTSSMPSQWSRDEEDGVIPPRGIVLNRAASINRGEIDALNEKIGFLERQLKNKENVIHSLKTEATELETQSLLERKDRELRILDEDVAFLKQENQKKERELLTKIGEINKKNYEIEQWKAEASNSARQRERMEAAYMNLQNQLKSLHGAETKLAELQTKYSGIEKQKFELSEKVKKLEKTEKEFKKLEHNIQLLQAQVQEMDIVEQDRNNLIEKMKFIEGQRDDLLRKGQVVETERNDFLRNNKLMEMQRDELDSRCSVLQKTNTTLNSRLAQLEHDVREAQTKMHDSLHERNFLQVQLDKMETEKNEMQTRLSILTQERNSLENQVAELQDLNRDHVKLEDRFHSLRIKLAETTRQKDDAEMQIPTLKAKVSLLKRACKEKDELIDKLNEEIRDLRHSIATSALDDISKIRSYGYSPENFVKLSAQRDREHQTAKRDPKDLVEERLQSNTGRQSPHYLHKSFEPSPPGTKKAKRFIVLFDYDPYKSPSSEHPELELKLKEGDLLTVFGDMDISGYFEADVNGERGLVPSLYVEEVEDDNDSDLALEEQLTKSHRDPLKDVALYKDNELQFYRDNISCGRCSPSSVASSTGSETRQCMVALHDYDPFRSAVPGRPPHDQLPLKKGNIMTAFGDLDVNGFYSVDLNGQRGFVPARLVEEVSSSSFVQPASSRAPEQILGVLDNIQVRGQPKASSTHMLTPPGLSTYENSIPVPLMGSVIPPSHVGIPVGLNTPPNHMRLPGSPNTPLPTSVGLTRFKPSPDVAMLGPTTAVIPVNSTRSSQQTAPLSSQEPVKTSLPPSASKQIVPAVSTKSRSNKVRPSAPNNFRIIRPVNHDAMLLGWTLPKMDEFGRSRGLTVKGYKIYANDDVRLDVRSPYMAKALVEGLELGLPVEFSVKTVAENGTSSETVSATFNDTIKGSLLYSRKESFEDLGDEQHYKTFLALYDYDPFKSSPNQNPAAEMGFKEGDIVKVFDTSRKDGFFVGKLKNKKGLIPSNFVEEVAVASPLRLAAAKKRQAALPSPTRPYSGGSSSSGSIASPAIVANNSVQLKKKMMVALYDYNPEVQSPQDNPDSELPFKKGQIFTVLGNMSADGFYHAEVNGVLGLVPGSFLNEYTTGETVSGLESGRREAIEKSGLQRLVEQEHNFPPSCHHADSKNLCT